MGFNTDSALATGGSGAMTGAMVGGPLGAAIGGGVGMLAGGFLGGQKKVGAIDPYAILTPEQRAAMSQLSNFAQTGKFGNFTAGEEQNLGYGDYYASSLENQGQSKLRDLLNGGIPDQYRLGDEALKGFLNTDPNAIKAQFDPFAAQVQRQIRDSNTALKRGAGFAGNLYSTNTIRNLGEVQARGNETLTSELARLTNQAADRRMQAIPLAYQSAESQQNAKMQQISAAHQYGALTRQLNDASIKARDAEILRRRQELQMPIDAAKALVGANVNYAQPGEQKSPYSDLLGLVGMIGGQYAGGYASSRGAAAGKVAGTPAPVPAAPQAAPSPYLFAQFR